MAKDELIDDRVSLDQCKKAVDALFAHVTEFTAKKAETQLLPDAEQSFWLTVALKKQPQSSSLKVFSIPVAYPIVDPRKESVCLITKDPQRTYKDLIADNNINFIHKVVGISKLKGKYKAYDARRALLKEHGLFLADDRVIPILPKLLGSKFFHAKKQPLPVNVTRKDLKKELERAISSTYMPSIRGTALSIRVGRLSQPAAQVVSNIKTALPAIAARVNDGWDNIQSLGLKTSTSILLPIWSCQLDDSEGGRWAGLTAEDEEDESEAEDDDDEDEGTDEIGEEDVNMSGDGEESDKSAIVQTTKPTGKKRPADTDGDNDVVENLKKKKSKKSSDVSHPPPSTIKTADVTSKSTKSKKIVSSSANENPTSASPAKATSIPKAKTKKAPAHEAPILANTSVTPKKAAAPDDKSITKRKPTRIVDVADVALPAVVTTADLDSSASILKKKKKEEKKTVTSAFAPALTVTTTSAESVPAPAKKGKKPAASKAAAADALPSKSAENRAKEVESAVNTAQEKGSSKKEKKKKEPAPPPDVPKETPVVNVEIQDEKEKSKQKRKEKKEKKEKPSNSNENAETTNATVTVAEQVEKEEKKKDKKEKKKGEKSRDTAAVTSGDDAMVVDSVSAKTVSEKKDKKLTATQGEQVSLSVTKEELKQKKSKAPGEKKKSKVVKPSSKGAKATLLGNKTA
ncbi:ribosomal protein L1p/L10e family-domain-containing protein [Lentinula detonsa]|uniref:Ribosomal L1 domain-containing protein 1 n=1 Tax=Lentinula detonsa TaxID=2804962 RepID=A0AA38PQR4_9AGAR|nr:ribosomal protein L1p/L10e family-domain-containing protein [Lentinula detonsa]